MPNLSASIVAEQEIKRYAHDNYLWGKYVCNVDLSAQQEIMVEDSLNHPTTVNVQPPRTGKSFAMAFACLKEMACNPFEDVRFFAPARYQALLSLREQRQMILRSPILQAFIAIENGKRQFKEFLIRFANASNAEIFGQNSNLDGVNASIINLDETDDLDPQRVFNNILPRGARANRNGLPTRIRVTGVIQQENGLLRQFEQNPDFKTTIKWTLYHNLRFGVIDLPMFRLLKASMSADEWLRNGLVRYAEGRSYIPARLRRWAQLLGGELGLKTVTPEPGRVYHPRGSVHAGYDAGASGSGPTASFHSLSIVERLDDLNLTTLLYAREWAPTESPRRIRQDIVEAWRFFNPEGGYGDAYAAGMLQDLNADLYEEGLVAHNAARDPNDEASWKTWDLKPLRNHGVAKHKFYKTTKTRFQERRIAIPDVKDHRWSAKAGARQPAQGDDLIPILLSQLGNLQARRGQGYDIIKPEIETVGDDNADAFAMAVYHADQSAPKVVAPIYAATDLAVIPQDHW